MLFHVEVVEMCLDFLHVYVVHAPPEALSQNGYCCPPELGVALVFAMLLEVVEKGKPCLIEQLAGLALALALNQCAGL